MAYASGRREDINLAVRDRNDRKPGTAATAAPDSGVDADLAAHYKTYNAFVKYLTWAVALAVVVLALLAYFLV
jgi:hypothetical protein